MSSRAPASDRSLGTLLEQRNCHCLTRISRISQIEPVALLTSVLGWTVSLLKGYDLGQPLASRGRSSRKRRSYGAETPAVDATGSLREYREFRVGQWQLRCSNSVPSERSDDGRNP